MKHMRKNLAVLLLAAASIVFAAATPAFASVAQTTYTLTYPNGEVVTTTDKDEADALLDEWKLLATAETDENGDIVLEDWATEGEIKIVEAEVPEGYTAETTETIANLSDGEVTIVNKKNVTPTPDKPKPSTPTKKAKKALPKTGDVSQPVAYLALAASGALAIAAARTLAKRESAE